MTDCAHTPTKQHPTQVKVARSLILFTAVLASGLLGLASSAQANHGGSHSIKVDQSANTKYWVLIGTA